MTLEEIKWFSSFAKMIGSYKYPMWIASSDTGSNFVLENNSVSHTITHIVILPMQCHSHSHTIGIKCQKY